MTKQELSSILPHALTSNILKYCDQLNLTMEKYEVDTLIQKAGFLAQIGAESEYLTYTAELWGTQHQLLYERDFSQAWRAGLNLSDRNYLAYSLGNIQIGDGKRFKGRGLIQTTGRTNYELVSKALGIDFLQHPELLEGVVYACDSAGYFWQSHNLNQYDNDFDGLCDAVNIGRKTKKYGDSLGFAKRLEIFNNAKKVFNLN